MTIIDELWCIYHVLLRQNKYATSFFSCSNSSIRPKTQSWNYESYFFSRKWMGLFSNNWKLAFLVKINQHVNFENLFWVKPTKFRICRFRIGCCFWWNSYKKWSCHPRPTDPREVPQSIRKNRKKRKKRTLSTYFPPNPYFLPDTPCFYFKDRRKKKKWLIITK